MIEKPTIHIIDDDSAICASLEALFSSIGLGSKSYHTGEIFLEGYTIHRVGCVLLDVRMPGMSGLQVQREINVVKYAMPVIMMTGHADVQMAVESMKMGALNFIEKPFNEQSMIDLVQEGLSMDQQGREKRLEYSAFSARIANLTDRERQVLSLVIKEFSNKSIAEQLGVSIKTVEYHRSHMMEKMHAKKIVHLLEMLREYEFSFG
ncbi:MAG: Two component transcriptional regulator, LuxR family [uncultured Thiotrichaceae bacterium]|uniref:Two component transcriptional regulator, LuxR family n=1 Tax=uncultured Thiotrichaceae bacterium TaxID=298394 RepID=A0A6S6SGK6_9GAMM|nr:MAG: Two component transcriptional regulator, LuxR family [uncultured Thiotrichaceae bacterium]